MAKKKYRIWVRDQAGNKWCVYEEGSTAKEAKGKVMQDNPGVKVTSSWVAGYIDEE